MKERIEKHEEAIKEVRKLNNIKTTLLLLLSIIFLGISIKVTFTIAKVFLLLVSFIFIIIFLKYLINYIKDLIFFFVEKNKKEKNVELENDLVRSIEQCKSTIANNKTYFEAKRAYNEAVNILEKHRYDIPMTTVFAAEDELKKLKEILNKCNSK